MKATLFSITAQTNLHVGSGDANYGIIDKLVQRDTLTQLPVIHASSLKGALLQHFYYQTGMTDEYIDEVFGGQSHESKRISRKAREESKSGEFVFMEAQLLSIPVRSNQQAFFRATGSQVLTELRQQLLQVQLLKKDDDLAKTLEQVAAESKNKAIVLEQNWVGKHHLEDLKNENFTLTAATGPGLDLLKSLLGNAAVIVPDAKLRQLTDNHHLPVIARNHLENGQSINLWYEQVVPRQTRFWFSVLHPETARKATDFSSRLTDQGMIQIGANATVGYGYCAIKKQNSKP